MKPMGFGVCMPYSHLFLRYKRTRITASIPKETALLSANGAERAPGSELSSTPAFLGGARRSTHFKNDKFLLLVYT